MSLVEKKSLYDRHIKDVLGGTVGQVPLNSSPYYMDGGKFEGGKELSPFKSTNPGTNEDQLVDLLKDYTVNSANTGLSYNPEELRSPGNRHPNFTDPSGDQDFDGQDNGQGIFTIGHLQGKQIKGNDLHVHLLAQSYTYQHGDVLHTVNPSPANVGDFQDFIDTLTPTPGPEQPGANPSLGQFGGPYNTTGPSDGRY